MISLPNGCQRSLITVTPCNWAFNIKEATEKAAGKPDAEKVLRSKIEKLLKKKWKIYYRYYDSQFKDDPEKWGYLVQIRAGINSFKDLAQRQDITRSLIDDETNKVDKQGYNPITGQYHSVPEVHQGETLEEITPSTPFITALLSASKMITCGDVMLKDIKCIIRGIDNAATKLFDKTFQKPYKALTISQVSRKHIIYLFQQCKKDNKRFSPYRQNKYRTGLMILYTFLVTVEALESNIIKDIPINSDYAHKKREVLTEAEQVIINTNLKAWDYYFWRYMRIFFRSTSRSTELRGVKPEHVNLEKQEVELLIKKGRKWVWQIRTIPDDVLQFWIEVMNETNPGEFLFGTLFRPGPISFGVDNPTKKWKKYVKNPPGKFDPHKQGWGLGINKDFYSLKTLNMDKIDEKAGEQIEAGAQLAADAAGHGDTKMAKKHYLPGHEKRQRERIKKIPVPFALIKDQQN